MIVSEWRKVAAPIIARVLKETHGQTEKEIRAALTAAYPFGVRRFHPYKIWLDEIRKQRNIRPAVVVQDMRRAWFELTEARKAQ